MSKFTDEQITSFIQYQGNGKNPFVVCNTPDLIEVGYTSTYRGHTTFRLQTLNVDYSRGTPRLTFGACHTLPAHCREAVMAGVTRAYLAANYPHARLVQREAGNGARLDAPDYPPF